MKSEEYWLDQEIDDIKKEVRKKKSETSSMLKFLLFLLPFSLICMELQGVLFCPHCERELNLLVVKEVQWRCQSCRYYNSDSSGGDWAGDYYCGKCGAKK